MQSKVTQLPAPPIGIIDSLTRGFEILFGALPLLLPPLLLDVLLWLGPRLSIEALALPAIRDFFEAYREMMVEQLNGSVSTMDAVQEINLMQESAVYIASHFNALGALTTAPLGVPCLMGRMAPEAAPGGITPMVWNLESVWLAAGVVLAIGLIGFLLGAAYLGLIAQLVCDGAIQPRQLVRALPRYWINMVALALIILSAAVAAVAPFFAAFACLSVGSPMLGFVVLMLGLSVGMWAVIFLGFAVHAMMLQGRDLFPAIGDSLRVVKANAPNAVLFFLTVSMIYWGLGMVFRGEVLGLPEPVSWLWLLGLMGHAFVATGLFIATFVYYQDRYRHYEEFRAYLAHQSKSLV